MSDNDRDSPLFRNEETLRRRAWIDRAISGVRERLRPAELGEPAGVPTVDPAAGLDGLPGEVRAAEPQPNTRPRLYVVRNDETS